MHGNLRLWGTNVSEDRVHRKAKHYLAGVYAPAAALVTAALAWRREWPADDEATELLSRELVPLYVQYLEDHIARLQAVNCCRLADSFQRWQARLVA